MKVDLHNETTRSSKSAETDNIIMMLHTDMKLMRSISTCSESVFFPQQIKNFTRWIWGFEGCVLDQTEVNWKYLLWVLVGLDLPGCLEGALSDMLGNHHSTFLFTVNTR